MGQKTMLTNRKGIFQYEHIENFQKGIELFTHEMLSKLLKR